MQAIFQGGGLTGEIGVGLELRDPDGCGVLPDPAWKPDPSTQCNFACLSLERRGRSQRPVPDCRAPKLFGMRVDSPETPGPIQVLADRLEDLPAGLAGESASARTRVVSYCAASLRSAFLRRVISWKTTTPPWSPARPAEDVRSRGSRCRHRGWGRQCRARPGRSTRRRCPHQGKILDRVGGLSVRQEDLEMARPLLGGISAAAVAQNSLCRRVEDNELRRFESATTTPSPMQSRTDRRIRVCSRSAASDRASSAASCS